MQNHQQSDRLSWGDTVFLHLEREGMPLNVASVCIFEGQISLDQCIQFVESKLPYIPRYLKRVVGAPLGLGLPTWEYDPDFDLRDHVREVTLKRGTDAELKAVAGKLFSKVMDRRHPLWDVTVVRGLKGDRTAVIFRLHHCLADGIAGVSLMNVLLDSSPKVPELPRKKFRLRVPPPPGPFSSLAGGVVDSYSDFIKRVLSALADLLSMAEQAAANGGSFPPAADLLQLLPEISAFTERMRFNVPYQGPQKFDWTEISLADVKSIREAFKTSVNDVILALVTAAVRSYLEWHGDRVKGRLFRMMVPVNLRGNGSPSELGNRISLVPVTVPLHIRDPRRLLLGLHRRTEFLKHAHAAELVSLTGGMLGMLPTTLQAMVGPFLSRLPITPFNLVCTNVPGPQGPLYLLGHRMLQWYPYVPVGGEMALNCAVLSYDGKVYFGFSGDVHASPDLGRLPKFLKVAFMELREAAGILPPRRKSRPTKRMHRNAEAKQESASGVIRVSIPLGVPFSSSQSPVAEENEALEPMIA